MAKEKGYKNKDVKAIRLKIIKPINVKWEEFGYVLRTTRYYTVRILNYYIQKYYEWYIFSKEYFNKNGVYPKYEELYGCSLRTTISREVKTIYPNLFNTYIFDALSEFGTLSWKNAFDNIVKLKSSIPHFKLTTPIYIRERGVKVKFEDNKYIISLNFLQKDHKLTYKNEKIDTEQFDVIVDGDKPYLKKTLEKIINEEYTIGTSSIKEDNKGDWYISISYKMPKKQANELDKNRILGVDLGIVNAVTLQIYDATTGKYEDLSWHKSVIEGGEIERFRQQIEKRRKLLQKQSKWCSEGRIGHGRKAKNKPIDIQIYTKISNFRDTINHNYSRYIVDLALKNNCGVIQMEDLSGVSQSKKKKKDESKTEETFEENELKKYKNNKFLKNWSYYDLQQKIKYKAEQAGIKVIFVSPKYTSQRCSKCGYINEENRQTQANFKCLNCGYEENADKNAARNIAIPYIDMIIKEELKVNTNDDVINT
jgi:IS605 OrfB family transposase